MHNLTNKLKTSRLWLWIAGGIILMGILILATRQIEGSPRPAQARPNTVKAFTGDLTGTVTGVGHLIAHQDVNLAFQVSGTVKDVNVKLGDKVTAGTVLVSLDDADAQRAVQMAQNALDEASLKVSSAQVAYSSAAGWKPDDKQLAAAVAAAGNAAAAVQAAQSDYDKVAWNPAVSSTPQSLALQQATNNYTQAKANLDYLLTNRPDIASPKINLDLAKLGVLDAQFALDAARSTQKKMTLVAPFDGTITAVNVQVGEIATGPVVRMITTDDLEAVLNLDEAGVQPLALGQPAVIKLDAWPGSQVEGTVTYISPESQASQGNIVVNYEVRLSLGKTDLPVRAGLTADVTITSFSLKNVLLVPSGAVIPDRATGKYYVNLVTAQGAKKTEVTLGKRDSANTQIVSGLRAGDEVEMTNVLPDSG